MDEKISQFDPQELHRLTRLYDVESYLFESWILLS